MMKVQVFDEIKREENKQLIADMEKWEIKFSRDCCEFSYEQIMMYLKGKHSSSMFSLSKYVSFFKGGYTGRTGKEEEKKPVCIKFSYTKFIKFF